MKLSPLIALGSANIITFDYDQSLTEFPSDQVVSLRLGFKLMLLLPDWSADSAN